ncbi:hypothetical protein NMF85_09930 [Clostridioides difficile]|uniref:hypothetical protein n=1 Tax=Clostridioides difficile TaxID=1496 RepID=UPI001C1D72C9|nr:hypothetical protein [Clostridioides difficile]MCP8337838.1 hypothetical protein [Clostridioides difficile]MCP8365803.1 hypothetical protein [Clostridioides difficile]MCP8383260.1 hypothetical protein [Clostridioides difficile]MCP8415624.1 hypothetical protein [Clostridioides difficile]MCP8664503.1 hypothetical protein [Clostridioides difficile]
MSKVDKHFLLEKENVEYIKKLKEEKFHTESLAINHIIKEHREKETNDTQMIVSIMVDEVFNRLNPELKKYNTKLNATDKNVQIILELINGILVENNLDNIAMTDELESSSLLKARKTVTRKIEKSKYSKGKALY